MDANSKSDSPDLLATQKRPSENQDRLSPSVPRMRHYFGRRANAFMQAVAIGCLPLAYFIAWFVTWGFWAFARSARASSYDYLRRIDPDISSLALRWRSHRHFYEYAMSLIDSSIVLTGHGERFSLTCPDKDALYRAAESPGGLLIITAHVGTIEVVAPRLSQLLHNRKAYFVMYQDMSDATEQFRSENWQGLQPFGIINSMDPISAGIQIAKALMAGDVVGMRADRKVSGKSIGADVLGQPAQLPHGPFMAAVATGATVVFAFAFRTGHCAYELHVSEPRSYGCQDIDDKPAMIEKAAREFAAALSAAARSYPNQWFNFYPFWLSASDPEKSKIN